jgi:hypothetical protein
MVVILQSKKIPTVESIEKVTVQKNREGRSTKSRQELMALRDVFRLPLNKL